jgi:hypothetical protein
MRDSLRNPHLFFLGTKYGGSSFVPDELWLARSCLRKEFFVSSNVFAEIVYLTEFQVSSLSETFCR